MSKKLKELAARLIVEAEVPEHCKQAVKAEPTPANRAFLREAREHVRLFKGEIDWSAAGRNSGRS